MNFTKFTVLRERKRAGPKSPKTGGFRGDDLGFVIASDYHNKRNVGQGILQ
jgi:hypothetical protein